jgi:hypothetical protein
MALNGGGVAEAGPWTRDDGGFYGRVLYSMEDLDGVDGHRVDAYGEYGLTQRWTLTAKTEAVTYPDDSAINRESYRMTLRRQVWRHGGWTVGAEGGPVYGSAIAGLSNCDKWGGEARLSGGFSGARKGRDFYVFSDLAVIGHEDGCVRQRAEFGYGADLTEHVFTTQQVWLERGNDSADSYKMESQIGYHLGRIDLSVGYREEFGSAYDESAVLVALTTRR